MDAHKQPAADAGRPSPQVSTVVSDSLDAAAREPAPRPTDAQTNVHDLPGGWAAAGGRSPRVGNGPGVPVIRNRYRS
jgi:hypothetical protein